MTHVVGGSIKGADREHTMSTIAKLLTVVEKQNSTVITARTKGNSSSKRNNGTLRTLKGSSGKDANRSTANHVAVAVAVVVTIRPQEDKEANKRLESSSTSIRTSRRRQHTIATRPIVIRIPNPTSTTIATNGNIMTLATLAEVVTIRPNCKKTKRRTSD